MKFEKGHIPFNKGKVHLKEANNPNWKGDEVGYTALHDWLRKNFGKANKCEICKILIAKKYEWALLKGKEYERKRENFWQLCSKCHTKYDDKCPSAWNKGRKETRPEVLKRQRESHKGLKYKERVNL